MLLKKLDKSKCRKSSVIKKSESVLVRQVTQDECAK
jgi:hypothetical protein